MKFFTFLILFSTIVFTSCDKSTSSKNPEELPLTEKFATLPKDITAIQSWYKSKTKVKGGDSKFISQNIVNWDKARIEEIDKKEKYIIPVFNSGLISRNLTVYLNNNNELSGFIKEHDLSDKEEKVVVKTYSINGTLKETLHNFKSGKVEVYKKNKNMLARMGDEDGDGGGTQTGSLDYLWYPYASGNCTLAAKVGLTAYNGSFTAATNLGAVLSCGSAHWNPTLVYTSHTSTVAYQSVYGTLTLPVYGAITINSDRSITIVEAFGY